MPAEPSRKRAMAFVDGQNLFYAAKKAFGYSFPNYDVSRLAQRTCAAREWLLTKTFFYTGVPDLRDNSYWHHFWAAKLAVMGTRGVVTYARPLRYRHQTVQMPSGEKTTFLVGQEKGVDIRIALDVVRLARENAYDIALIFSQDQDLSEAVDEVKSISIAQRRWIKVACAFPASPVTTNRRGINNTDWIPIERTLYDECLDPNDYRLKS